MKIVVLAGGISSERQVSLVTGTSICRALRSNGHRAILVDLFLGMPGWTGCGDDIFDTPDGFCKDQTVGRDAPSLEQVMAMRGGDPRCHLGPNVLEICRLADFVFLGLHGIDGEDGKIQAVLELMGIPYSGSDHISSGMAMDKITTKKMMEHSGIRTPVWREVHVSADNLDTLAAELPVPCAIKTPCGGSSIGVVLADSREELRNGLLQISVFSSRILVEAKLTGRELTIPVLDDRYLSAIEIVPPDGTYFDYISKYQGGSEGAREICPAPITDAQFKEMGETALKLHRSLGLKVYSRTDFMLDRNGIPWCLEINTLPGMTPASLFPKSAAAAGLSYEQLCETIVELSLKARSEQA